MKKIISLLVVIFICGAANSQGKLLKKAVNSIASDLTGSSTSSSMSSKPKKEKPEPPCACSDATVIMDLNGNLMLDYTEMSISVKDDGSLLVKDLMSTNYYIVKDGVTTGPITEGDPRIAEYRGISDDSDSDSESDSRDELVARYKEYISKEGDKYMISFQGKTYGPYALISNFAVTRSKDKFAAKVTENLLASENDGKKIEEAMKNAKSDQERMELAMQFSQMMANNMMQQGGPESSTPKIITNVPDVNIDPLQGGNINARMKYDEIVLVRYDGIYDMFGKKIITIRPEHTGSEIFIHSANTKYAVDTHGGILFSDNTTMTELFCPHFVKTGGKVFLAYMYYSPKMNAIMQCRIPY